MSILWVALLSKAPITVTLVIMFVLYLTVLVVSVVLGGGSYRSAEATDGLQSPEGAPTDATSLLARCEQIADEAKLSPRETEVFLLLVQGRSHSFIQEELGLSGSTVKTHVSHIYSKMNVQGRQELLDLIWH